MEKQLTTETRTEILKADNLMILILSLILSFFLFLSIHVLVVHIEIPDVFVWLFLAGFLVMCTAFSLYILIASIRYKRPLEDIFKFLFMFLMNVGFCRLVYIGYCELE